MKRTIILTVILLATIPARATIFLRYNTASQEIPIGIVVDSVDGDTEETGLTLSAATIHIWKSGGTRTFHGNGAAVHMNNGLYYYTADANDCSVKGSMAVFVHASGGSAERIECAVLDPNEYDRMFSTGEMDLYSIRSGTPMEITDVNQAALDAVATIQTVTDKLATMLVLAGAVYRFTSDAVTNTTGASPLGSGTAQAGTTSTITLSNDANSTDAFYSSPPTRVVITGGKGAGQSRLITGYVGSTRVATVDLAWVVIPNATSTYNVEAASTEPYRRSRR